MTKFNHDSIVPFKDSDLTKKQQVAKMFNHIAFRYDFLNRFLSGGVDVYWRRRALREISGSKPKFVLDVATGTGDMAILISRMLHTEKTVGIDISEGMLEVGRKKIAKLGLAGQVDLLTGDAESIQFPDNSFDAITVAFGVRNFEKLQTGLSEMKRVLKPGGKLLILEFSKPRRSGFKHLYDFYMKNIAPGVGKFFSKNEEAYKYLDESVRAFPEGEAFLTILNDCGYISTGAKKLTQGICTIYSATKP